MRLLTYPAPAKRGKVHIAKEEDEAPMSDIEHTIDQDARISLREVTAENVNRSCALRSKSTSNSLWPPTPCQSPKHISDPKPGSGRFMPIRLL